ncbi:trypsin [Pilimelia anulata]|uniref:Trypsin n=1 Tax=Pilimelia anulata TaxID=53371 RepID=A0A8J3FCH0_9ACTN|nr:serine protease [Pilimelia anulata]GGK06211.1 trypsin [Pilimelia anulata]
MQRPVLATLAATAALLAATAAAPAAFADPTPAGPAPADPGQGRIVGGRPSAAGAYPWMANLHLSTAGGESYSCGGTLLSPDIVLTAEHCTDDRKVVRVDAHIGKVRWADAQGAGQVRRGTKYKTGGGTNKGDWAVVKLDTPYTGSTYPALPRDAGADERGPFRAMGWGLTKENGSVSPVLLEVDLPHVPAARCQPTPAVEICAGDYDKGGVDTCQGDSGGPLVARDGAGWVQVGITSWGVGCARPGEPGHYTKVSAFLKQIRAAVTELGGQQPATR